MTVQVKRQEPKQPVLPIQSVTVSRDGEGFYQLRATWESGGTWLRIVDSNGDGLGVAFASKSDFKEFADRVMEMME